MPKIYVGEKILSSTNKSRETGFQHAEKLHWTPFFSHPAQDSIPVGQTPQHKTRYPEAARG